ncbi:hypothetical protein [Clostridium sardiniense]|uniref:hypothetical protein n=1 Tax=Clostridium sardiniense TaxID=29369 RepID=UPI00195AD86D|nr:hypothetical protein [Clostridium sardiniense]MBM7836319.1 Tfp pilus assembly ATPase PilU [Clostridium sardiniense]
MKKKYKLIEVIEIMTEEQGERFQRVNDENFIVYRDEIGRLMCKVKDNPGRTLNLFNYMQDLWIMKEE